MRGRKEHHVAAFQACRGCSTNVSPTRPRSDVKSRSTGVPASPREVIATSSTPDLCQQPQQPAPV